MTSRWRSKADVAPFEYACRRRFDAARNKSEALADQIKATLNELGETLSKKKTCRAADPERPIAALASAFALGVAIGFMLRRH